jgi:ABC-type sugar transport system substrate-binding protein
MRRSRAAAALAVVTLIALAGCSDADTSANSETNGGESSAGVATDKAPYTYAADWGTFKLSSKIADKLKAKQSINVVLSMQGQTTPIYGPQYKYGLPLGIADAKSQYGIDLSGKLIGPITGGDNAQQVSQIESAAAAGQIDCLALDGGGDPAFERVINKLADQGIPVFTTGTDLEKSHRLSTFHTDWAYEGQLAAKATADFFEAKGVPLKTVAMTSGAVDQIWAQTRMDAFHAELQKLVPGVEFLNDTKGALMTGFSPTDVYSKVRSYMTGHKDLQVMYQTDTGGATVDKVITDLKRKGQTFTVGHNISAPLLDQIEQGVQIATLSQDYPAQAGFAGRACGAFLAKGEVLPNENKPELIDSTNIEQARENFLKSTGGA